MCSGLGGGIGSSLQATRHRPAAGGPGPAECILRCGESLALSLGQSRELVGPWHAQLQPLLKERVPPNMT